MPDTISRYESEFLDVLHDNITSEFHIEYTGYLSNHILHGVIALHRLGASTDRLVNFVNWYKDHLKKPEGITSRTQTKPEERTANIIREKQDYYHLLEYYTNKFETVYDHDDTKLDVLVREEFDTLHDGLVGSAMHGIIQLGYGYSCRSPDTVCEGLAYIHHSHSPMVVSEEAQKMLLGQGRRDVTDVLVEFGKDEDLKAFMLEEIRKPPLAELKTSNFQRKLFALLNHKGDDVLKYAHQVKTVPIQQNYTIQDAVDMCKWMFDTAVLIYTKAVTRNDFFFIHCVTASWALFEILPALSDPKQAIKCVKTMLCCLFAAYMAQGAPALTASTGSDVMKYASWEEIKKATVNLECDEHVYKLVQVVYDMSKEGNDKEKNELYMAAANVALNFNLKFN